MIQTSKNEMWIDESGTKIPFFRITKAERLKERSAAKLLKGAKKINADLHAYKEEIQNLCNNVYNTVMAELKAGKDTKGNFRFFNFDRSVKVEVSIHDIIDFDDLTIQAAKEKYDEFLKDNIESKNAYIKEMILDAFSTSRGKLDVKKVLGLLKWEDKINNPKFTEASRLLRKAISRPSSRTYFRVWEKDASGKYINIDLNFSSI